MGIIYNRIKFYNDEQIPIKQACFRQGRNFCNQVHTFTSLIDDGFQNKKKQLSLWLIKALLMMQFDKGIAFKIVKNYKM